MRQLAANRVWFSVRAALGLAALAVGGCWGRPDFIIYFYPEDANDETDAENDADSGPYVVEPQHGTASWRCSGGVLEEQRSDGTWERAWDCRTSGRICDARTTSCLQRCQSDTDCATGPDGSERQCRSDGRCASRVFETVWAIEDDDLLLTLPFFDDGSRTAKCNYRVLWGDEPKGTRIEDQQPIRNCPSVDPMAHKYKSKGDYYIKILGIYNGWGTDIAPVVSGCEKASLTRRKEVVSFGSVGLTSGAFACTHNVKLPVNEIPNPQNWTNAEGMFLRAKGISDRISAWDTSGVLNMVMAFYAASEFDHSLRYWDTSNVVTMRGMFELAEQFDQPIGNWNTSKVATMTGMFDGATSFNQPIGNWDTSQVISMAGMFRNAQAFDQPVGSWNTCRVESMSYMFSGARGGVERMRGALECRRRGGRTALNNDERGPGCGKEAEREKLWGTRILYAQGGEFLAPYRQRGNGAIVGL